MIIIRFEMNKISAKMCFIDQVPSRSYKSKFDYKDDYVADELATPLISDDCFARLLEHCQINFIKVLSQNTDSNQYIHIETLVSIISTIYALFIKKAAREKWGFP